MKTIAKIGIAAAGVVTVSALVAYNKTQKITGIFEQMDIEPDFITKPDISLERIKFNIDVMITNNSKEDLFVTGASVAKLTKLFIYYNNVYISTAVVNITEISIPASNKLVIKNIPVIAPIISILRNIGDILNFQTNKISVIGVVEVLGKEYQIGG